MIEVLNGRDACCSPETEIGIEDPESSTCTNARGRKRKQKRHAVQFGGGCEEGETSMWQAASGMQDKRNQ